ncbi:hypothetical protein [Aquabacterium sp. OR-4]|uniref:hypothetical protein n=1 Tax=Aquabacterium sp. OR-4 TaxID=2978127 RepID=UPI0028C89CB0|nr:hypothetical protein [Aquabacterium sp. OR-4]MDT7836444.1 hypothetical protein [Aquabacterium sp. OR-4]
MTARRELLALLAVVATFWGYYALSDDLARRWAYYAAQGALLAGAGWLLRCRARTFFGLLACCVMQFEGAQQAACGAAHMAMPPAGDACVNLIGAQPYQALLSLAAAALIARRLWRRPHDAPTAAE